MVLELDVKIVSSTLSINKFFQHLSLCGRAIWCSKHKLYARYDLALFSLNQIKLLSDVNLWMYLFITTLNLHAKLMFNLKLCMLSVSSCTCDSDTHF